MSFCLTPRLYMQLLIKSEVIYQNLIKAHIYPSRVADKYINEIKEVQFDRSDTSIWEYLDFPFKTFYNLNNDSLKYIISKSFDIMKEKGLGSNPMLYRCVLRAYLQYEIDIDVQTILQDVVKYRVALDQEICSEIIAYYCSHGEMSNVEILLDEMKSQNISLSDSSLFEIISGYITSRQTEKADFFIFERDLKAECHFMLYSRCLGYASNGDVASLKQVLAEMKEKNLTFVAFRYFTLYKRLLRAKVDTTSLNEIIDLTRGFIAYEGNNLFKLVASLNRADQFDYSLVILRKLIHISRDVSGFFQIFATERCPPNIFMEFLAVIEQHRRFNLFLINIFGDMSFDIAFDISKKLQNSKKWKIIFYSLINKAACEKSIPLLEDALTFTYRTLKLPKFNILLSQSLLPAMVDNGMVSNYDEILEIFPSFRNQILQVALMKYLCYGQFDQYNNLRLKHKGMTNLYLISEWKYLRSELSDNISFSDIEQWSMEARKCFQSKFVDTILENLVTYELIEPIKSKSNNKIETIIDYAKLWNVKISDNNFAFLLKTFPEHSEVLFISQMNLLIYFQLLHNLLVNFLAGKQKVVVD